VAKEALGRIYRNGEMAIFDRTPHLAIGHARGNARILTVEKRAFLRRVQEDPSLALHILQNMSNRIRDLSEKLARHEEREGKNS
jgi:CRP-like cAMP-binding protein